MLNTNFNRLSKIHTELFAIVKLSYLMSFVYYLVHYLLFCFSKNHSALLSATRSPLMESDYEYYDDEYEDTSQFPRDYFTLQQRRSGAGKLVFIEQPGNSQTTENRIFIHDISTNI